MFKIAEALLAEIYLWGVKLEVEVPWSRCIGGPGSVQ